MDTNNLPPDPDWRDRNEDRHESSDDGPWYQQPATVLVMNPLPVAELASEEDRRREREYKAGRDLINEEQLNEMGL